MTLNCDLDLVSAWLSYELHIVSLRQTYDQSLKKSFQGYRRYGADTKFKAHESSMLYTKIQSQSFLGFGEEDI